MQMTEEQKQLAVDNMQLVIAFMERKHLTYDVYYDLLLEELCKVAMDYDPNCGSFSTLAYVYFLNAVRLHIYNSRLKKNYIDREGAIVYLDSLISEDGDMYEIIDSNSEDPLDVVVDQCLLNDIFSCCSSERDKEIVNYLANGLNLSEIAKLYSVTRERIRQIVNRIRKKYIEKFGEVSYA